MMMKIISAAALTAALAVPSVAATLNGSFNVLVVNAQGLDDIESQATLANGEAAFAAAQANTAGYAYDYFTYVGDIDFKSFGGATTIAGWLASAVGGVVSGLDIGNLQLSAGDITKGTATTSFFAFELASFLGHSDFTIEHDDGVAVFDLDGEDPVLVGGFVGPNSVRTTQVNGFNGGGLGILYVATNSDPSILNVDVAAVPVPAAGFLLIGALGGLAALRRRKTA